MNVPIKHIAVLIPCHNEAITVASVVTRFKHSLPEAAIYVFDNLSTDATAARAAAAGATVIPSPVLGKGVVIRDMFARIHADYYLLIDGDDTYAPEQACRLIEQREATNAAMVIGARNFKGNHTAISPVRKLGNYLFTSFLQWKLGTTTRDVLSGYRLLTRELVERITLSSTGFEIEVELLIKANRLGFTVSETEVDYFPRPAGSVSKLNVVRDGLRIIRRIVFSS